ncbi:hypothetical protein K490DRAFT_51087 [Saccharata proteae CBS 121410]|uniref:RED-like N-terminal domain-containing protein n=1 Tax=Saccharata proteae CBS 121410 TaxID=1314787 RepID=A0A9P4HN86_9PEZI|nr:hypothetical protein K490DRAFT_51087 [Saccharata proteae CBS 121410]
MNQDDFRRLVQNTPSRPQNGDTPSRPSATPGGSMLGSRKSSSIPMTPRTVRGGAGVDFRRQLMEQHLGSQQSKKFRSSAAPKGTKLAAGFVDRTQQRVDEEEDDRAKRIKALEEQMKLGQIEPETFEKLRDQITGGDIGATHLVKGLDRQLLERVRRGEDVLGGGGKKEEEPSPDVDDEFEKLEEKEVAPVTREKTVKKGEKGMMPPPPPVAGAKRSRDAILAELKASRKAAAEAKAAALPQLGAKFRKIGEKRETSRIERDDRGREVLITTDADGNVKRKVRKVKVEEEEKPGLLMPDPDAKPLGMVVPERPPTPEEKIDDIFEGVGDDYDPLAGIGDDDSSSSSDDSDRGEDVPDTPPDDPNSSKQSQPTSRSPSPPQPSSETTSMPPPPAPQPSLPKTNYFKDTPSAPTISTPSNPLTDPTILAAIKKAREIDPSRLSGAESTSETASGSDPAAEEARLKRRAAMLSTQDRDFEDMDMGFGSSRFGDAEEAEEGGGKVKLSEWKGMGAEDDGDDGVEGKSSAAKRKRGPKKRKGDKDSAADVLRVMEMRKGEKGK